MTTTDRPRPSELRELVSRWLAAQAEAKRLQAKVIAAIDAPTLPQDAPPAETRATALPETSAAHGAAQERSDADDG